MQGTWGWASGELQSSDSTAKWGQGQWENQGPGESSSQWEAGNWDKWSTDGSVHYEEFENVMRWDDSGALEALQSATEHQALSSKGLTHPQFFPDPDLYIQEIDWERCEDLKLPDNRETFSQRGESTGQRKRGRKGGGINKGVKRENEWYDGKDATKDLHGTTVDSKLSSRPFLEPSCNGEQAHMGQDHTISAHAPSYRGQVDPSLREVRAAPQLQPPPQDRTRVNWASRGGPQFYQKPSYSQPYRDQNYASRHWQDHSRTKNWDGQQNAQSRQTHYGWPQENTAHWQDHTRTKNWDDQQNAQSRQTHYGWPQENTAILREASGWIHRKGLYQSSQDLHGQGWRVQDEANWGGLPHQSPVEQSNRGPRHFNNATVFARNRNPQWKQQHPQQTWE